MTVITDYMSWNIEKFSNRHALKDVFRNVTVAQWIAVLIRNMQADLLGIMEVTLGDGDKAVALLTDALRQQAKTAGTSQNWTSITSDRSVPKTSTFAARADKYALIWDQATVTVSNAAIIDANTYAVAFADRMPMYWVTTRAGGTKKVSCLLWHAPQPKYHKKAATIQCMATLAAVIEQKTGITSTLISGDFNYATDAAAVYAPLTGTGFTGIFDGERSTLVTLKKFLKDQDNRRKMILNGDVDDAFLANAYDNVFLKNLTWDEELKVCVPYVVLEEINTNVQFQIVTRSQAQQALRNAKIISDHMPLVLTVSG